MFLILQGANLGFLFHMEAGFQDLITEAAELLKAQAWDVRDIISATVYWLKPVTRSGHIHRVGK